VDVRTSTQRARRDQKLLQPEKSGRVCAGELEQVLHSRSGDRLALGGADDGSWYTFPGVGHAAIVAER
jgi:hypothetical protein